MDTTAKPEWDTTVRRPSAWMDVISSAGVQLSAMESEDKMENVRSKIWGKALTKATAKAAPSGDCFKDVDFGPVENATKKEYDAVSGAWKADEEVDVLMGKVSVDKGSIRECFQCKVRHRTRAQSTEGWYHGSKNYFAKRFLPERGIAEEAALDDVKMQMTAKFYGDRFNSWLPPKKIDFLQCFVIQLHERPGKPIYFVEHFVEGTFEKHNSNAGYVNDQADPEGCHQRNTPQAFSHFTFEMSEGRLMVVDIQGVDDLYTDPAIHSVTEEFGDADLGVKGMALFFQSYKHHAGAFNPVSQFLCLPPLEDPAK
jgi:elongation factor 2 kinase